MSARAAAAAGSAVSPGQTPEKSKKQQQKRNNICKARTGAKRTGKGPLGKNTQEPPCPAALRPLHCMNNSQGNALQKPHHPSGAIVTTAAGQSTSAVVAALSSTPTSPTGAAPTAAALQLPAAQPVTTAATAGVSARLELPDAGHFDDAHLLDSLTIAQQEAAAQKEDMWSADAKVVEQFMDHYKEILQVVDNSLNNCSGASDPTAPQAESAAPDVAAHQCEPWSATAADSGGGAAAEALEKQETLAAVSHGCSCSSQPETECMPLSPLHVDRVSVTATADMPAQSKETEEAVAADPARDMTMVAQQQWQSTLEQDVAEGRLHSTQHKLQQINGSLVVEPGNGGQLCSDGELPAGAGSAVALDFVKVGSAEPAESAAPSCRCVIM